MANLIKRNSIIVYVLILFALITGVVCPYIIVRQSQNNEESNINTVCENYANSIEKDFSNIETTMDVFARAVVSNYDSPEAVGDLDKQEKVNELLMEMSSDALFKIEGAETAYLRYSPDLTSSTAGFYIKKYEETQTIGRLPVTDLAKYDSSDFERVGWYYVPLNAGEAVWIEPYTNGNLNEEMFSYVIPLYKDGVTLGVIGVDINITFLKEKVEAIADDCGGYVYILDRKEQLVEDICAGTLYKNSVNASYRMINGMTFVMCVPGQYVYKLKYGNVYRSVMTIYGVLFMAVLFLGVSTIIKPSERKRRARKGEFKLIYHIISSCIAAVIILQVGYLAATSMMNSYANSETISAKNVFDRTLVVVADQDFAPYSYYDNDKVTGHDIELINEIANRMGYNVEIKLMTWDDCKKEIDEGKADILMGVNSYTEKFTLDLTNIIVDDSFAIYGKTPVNNVLDVKNARVAAITGTKDIDVYGLEENATIYDYSEKELYDIETGQFDYGILRKSVADMIIAQNEYSDIIQVYNMVESPLSIGVNPKNEGMASEIDKIVIEMKEDGTLNQIYEKWIGNNTRKTVSDILEENSEFYIITTIILFILVLGYIVLKVSDKKNLELIVKSETDALTKINNRGGGENKIRGLMEDGIPGMFCLMDVDKFKSINDTYGHAVGDKALIAVADCLRRTFRDNDIVMRLGGDEFAVYASYVSNREIGEKIIRRLFADLEKVDIPEMKGRKLTVSLGATFYGEEPDDSFEKTYNRADKRTYKSKDMEGNYFTF